MSEHPLALTSDEIERARHVFTKIDANSNNAIDFLELRVAFEKMGQRLNDQQIFDLITKCDTNFNHVLEFSEFLRLIEIQKGSALAASDDANLRGAFIALGGNPDDKKSFIASARLKQLIKEEFALTFDIDDLCAQVGVVDGEKTGKVDFEKFTKLIALQPRQPVAKADPSDPFAKLGLA